MQEEIGSIIDNLENVTETQYGDLKVFYGKLKKKVANYKSINIIFAWSGCGNRALQLRSRISGGKGPATNAHVMPAQPSSPKGQVAVQHKIKSQRQTAYDHANKVLVPMKLLMWQTACPWPAPKHLLISQLLAKTQHQEQTRYQSTLSKCR